MISMLLWMNAASAISIDLPAYIVEGEATTFTIEDATARRAVYLAIGTRGLGSGPCPAALGGDCLDVVSPTTMKRTADANGEVSLTVTLPEAGVGAEYCLQAVSFSGGVAVKSDAVCTVGAISGDEAQYGSHDYLFTGVEGSIFSAGAYCGDRGMHVVTIESDGERDWLDAQLQAYGTGGDVWLGIFDEQTEGTWLDVWGEEITYTSWLAGEPNDLGDEDCGSLRLSTSIYGLGFNDVLCSEPSLQIVCEADGAQSLYGNHIYTFTSSGMTWQDAADFCEARGDYLVIPGDADEDAWVTSIYHDNGVHGWLGVTDAATEGTWLDVLGDAQTWQEWFSGEPNNSGDEDCVNIWSNIDGWNDADCAESFRFVCESY
ncbi:MAG TPA: C-type lectin domain-containing protein [Myxococcota bacterium]|nr:C-type lectin domain-containing protein [Myxococcota bacterium]